MAENMDVAFALNSLNLSPANLQENKSDVVEDQKEILNVNEVSPNTHGIESPKSPEISLLATGERLCDRCKTIDLHRFHLDLQSLSMFRLGYLTDITENTACNLCSLVCRALENSWTVLPLRVNRGLFRSGETRTEIWLTAGRATTSENPPRTINIEVCHDNTQCRGDCRVPGFKRDADGYEKFPTELRLLNHHDLPHDLQVPGLANLMTTNCSTSLMMDWYKRCKNTHEKEACGRSRIISEMSFNTPNGEHVPEARLVENTLFIDVEEMRLVAVTENCEFTALSYVWGSMADENLHTKLHNVTSRLEPNGMASVVLPSTIADSIAVTRDLNIKYLWVDSLCIVQDGEDKQLHIQNMDKIYGLASLVMVAAAGEDASAGLLGCMYRPRPRLDQIVREVQGLKIAVSLPPLKHILERSKWSTRGWTFQEWHLARRALIFTEQQVYYICSSGSFSEDINLEHVPPHSALNLLLENCNASTSRHYLASRYSSLGVNSGWVDYIQTVEDYSARELTYESDTLLAISGIFNNLHRASRNRFLCGLSTGYFHDALFWVPVTGAVIRWVHGNTEDPGIMFPTWSWAGWKGAVKYRVFPASDRPLVSEWSAETDEQSGSIGTPLSEPQNDRFLPGTTFFSNRPTFQDSDKETLRQGENEFAPNHLQMSILTFRAQIAKLQLAFAVLNDLASRALAILDQRGAYMGVALLNKQESEMEKAMKSFREVQCIAISVSTSKILYMDEPAYTTLPEDDEWINLLLVSELRNGLFIRSGVGQVSKNAWDSWAEAEMKEINMM